MTKYVVAWYAPALNSTVILSFKHKGLRKFYETGSKAGIQANQANRLRILLTALDTAITINDMDIPSFNLHRLRGKRKDIWSISISGNWRLTFRFENGNVLLLDYEDYH